MLRLRRVVEPERSRRLFVLNVPTWARSALDALETISRNDQKPPSETARSQLIAHDVFPGELFHGLAHPKGRSALRPLVAMTKDVAQAPEPFDFLEALDLVCGHFWCRRAYLAYHQLGHFVSLSKRC